MDVQTIVCGAYAANAYLVYEPDGENALLIDPGDDLPALRSAVRASGKRLAHIALTHGHFDHVLAAGRLRAEYGAEILIGEGDADCLIDEKRAVYPAGHTHLPFEPFRADRMLAEGKIALAGMDFEVILTPGHSPGGVCLLGQSALFTGDTLFENGYGRLDLPGGDMRAMRSSLGRLLALPGELTVYPGHGRSAELKTIKEAWGV